MAPAGFRRYARLETKLDLQPVPVTVGKKKKSGMRVWMRFDTEGFFETMELDRNALVRRAGILARDLRILGPIFAQSSCILARERAMVVNLEFIRAIVTAQEILFLYSENQQVTIFADQLRRQFGMQNSSQTADGAGAEQLPFEFRILEIILEVVCGYLDAKVLDLENRAYPALDALTNSVSIEKLELVRSVKNDLTQLTARVQKIKEELEQLLDDDEDMADLYLTRKLWQSIDSPTEEETSGKELALRGNQPDFYPFRRAASVITNITVNDNNVEELEMLLELYFMQTDRTLNKLAMLREYIHDTENFINIQLDSKRNDLINLQVFVRTASVSISFSTLVFGACSMNLPTSLYSSHMAFPIVTAGSLFLCVLIFVFVMVYARGQNLSGA